ncbi:MAG: response regulator transcription factor [Syntrophorhabdaceae bacterium]|nr:response regulator transcription factor [Syntrophorhabdaceae bacterium]
MGHLVAIIDDEEDILELVSINLKKAGFQTEVFTNAESFLSSLKEVIPDLIILDLMLPDMDGYDICRNIRNSRDLSQIPIIMLTAKADEIDRVLGLELGADDYVTKPFSPRELVARVKAVLRREEKRDAAGGLELEGILSLNPETHTVTVQGKKIDLTGTEFKILKILLSRKGKVFTRDEILDALWGNEKTVIDRTVDVHIRHLREKLGATGGIIKNVRGVGYKVEY